MLDIITITKNDLAGIKRTVKSTRMLRAKKKINQIIIDSSNSEISKQIKTFISNEKNITYYWEEARGVAAAFNSGLNKAKAGWVWFLNSGDEVLQNLDGKLFISLISKNRSDMIIFDMEFPSRTPKKPPLRSLWPPVYNWICHPATILNRELLLKNHGFDEKYKIAADGDLWLRLFNKDTTADLVSIPIVRYAGGGLSDNIPETAGEVSAIIRKNLWKIFTHCAGLGINSWKAYRNFVKKSKKNND